MFPYGAVYKVYREHTWDDIRRNLKSIKDLGMNHVVVWPSVFWWEDKSNPDYPWATGRKILEYAGEIGLKIIMETAGQIVNLEYGPDFRMKEEYYVRNKNGEISRDNNHYYFGYINYFHPEVRVMMKEYLEGIARNYKGYPALYGYDIWNETMFESFDEYTMEAFQTWLKNKYHSLDKLNDVWESTYSEWSQVQYTQLLWASVMPLVDYKQFQKESIGILLREWKGYMRAVDPNHIIIADIIHSMVTDDWGWYERAQDEWCLARSVDEMGISFYPKGGSTAMAPYKRNMVFSAIHSASKNGNYWVSELQSHHKSMYNPFSYVRPYELKWWNFEAISHGTKGIIYWKWNNFQKGLQTFGRGLVDSAGNITERADLAHTIATLLKKYSFEFTSFQPELPQAAILYDSLCHDFTKAFTLAYEPAISTTIYTDSIEGIFKGLWDLNIPADILAPTGILDGTVSRYKALFVTGQLNISRELATGLLKYVEDGGVLICDGKLGEISNEGILHAQAPGYLSDALGYSVGDMEPDNLSMKIESDGGPLSLDGYYERRHVHIEKGGYTVIGTYEDGRPAVIKRRHGNGEIVHITSLLWYGYMMKNCQDTLKFLSELAGKYGLKKHRVLYGNVKFSVMTGTDGSILLFVFNYEQESCDYKIVLADLPNGIYEVCNLETQQCSNELVSNQCISLKMKIDGQDVNIYKLTMQNVK